MNAIAQKCRPKHQVLVLKCYPRTTKGAVDVKPNSSELSYLLYYATSRRSKIQKVGSFLEKKTASDVWRLRIGYALPPPLACCRTRPFRTVTAKLETEHRVILEALIEKNPKDLPLFAQSVLKILDNILRSNDITMVESSIPTFEAFCAHHDTSSLLVDRAYLKQYESIVRQYASLASTRAVPGKAHPSKPVAMRWRNTGLEAIKCVASSDVLSSVSARQYEIIVPMILENLWTDNEDFLEVLLQRVQMEEKVDSDKLLRRRTSVATVRTAEGATGDTNPIALSGTAMDVDKLAEEDIGVLAMQCLKQLFVAPNRAQVRFSTVYLLRFIEERVIQEETLVKTDNNTGRDGGWAVKMFGLIAQWAPVQDRFMILVTTLDTMLRMPLTDETLPQHIVLTAMIGSLLRSDVNLIGLSVMDVLIGLIQHMRRLVQMPGAPIVSRGNGTAFGPQEPKSPTTEAAETVAAQRKELLGRIQQAIGDLATHVYYADQISDMISAILLRLRPGRSNNTGNSSPHGEKAEDPNASTTNSIGGHHGESLFSLTVAKTAALKAIKAILLVANPKTKITGNMSLSRNRVPIQVWEGTQWLLRDHDGSVRKAYTDAIVTWLDRETTGKDLQARDETAMNSRSAYKNGREVPSTSMARRVVSSASNREKVSIPRSHFLALLHLAVYDNAIQYVDYETDVVLLHVLLAKLVSRLGVNAVRYGLPMIFQLQEAIQEVETPLAKVRVGSLVHGYFWAVIDKFDIDGSVVGRAINNEVVRRRSKHFWVEGIHVPPPLIELVGTPGMLRPQPKMPLNEIESEALLPFDDRISLVEAVCHSYQDQPRSPPHSPATSPGRTFTHPILSSTLSAIPALDAADHELPNSFREQMLMEWSRDAVMVATQAGSKSASLNGSKTGTTGTNMNRLTINSNMLNGGHAGSPFGSQHNLRPASQPVGGNLAPGGGGGGASKLRKSSVRSGISPAPSSSYAGGNGGGGFVTSVDQLKMALSGHLQPPPSMGGRGGGTARPGAGGGDDDASSSDSMVSYDAAPSELSFNPPAQQQQQQQQGHPVTPATPVRTRSVSRERRASSPGGPLDSHPTHDSADESPGPANGDQKPAAAAAEGAVAIPPVPPLPSDYAREQQQTPPVAAQDHAYASSPPQHQQPPRTSAGKRSLRSRGGESIVAGSFGDEGPAMDLASLLRGIDSRGGGGGGMGESQQQAYLGGGAKRPPY
ncbi:uncharacterized protein E0L32_008386 [Thyridium curvatum]|uniref:Protein EFR3 n=1 Tax=Thyridium curvatum TaxID=1093900 RepID=A0A507ALP2_9PEZI|nr:uncharacterized protein E0L32_008386 [Thyridium curvatum]TPX10652.1 hypothetical protein E0L32_008386 [Thyridium curvatum]